MDGSSRVRWWSYAVVLLAALAGCTTGRIDIYSCEDPCLTCEVPCPDCPGECVTLPPLGFDGPALLWVGKEEVAPACPDRAPTLVYEGHADLDLSFECAPCACAEPACQFPEKLSTSTAPLCQALGQIDFPAPSTWTGNCVAPPPVPADQVGSVSIEKVTASPCELLLDSVPTEGSSWGSSWGTFARACAGEPLFQACGDPGSVCLPTSEPPPPGFRQCILYLSDDDPTCPPDYPEKMSFYDGLDDTRACTPCTCTEVTPSECSALMSVYEDPDCGSLVGSLSIGMVSDQCMDVMGGMGLESMKGEWLVNEPGTCEASGGEPVGEAIPTKQRTFCCGPPAG